VKSTVLRKKINTVSSLFIRDFLLVSQIRRSVDMCPLRIETTRAPISLQRNFTSGKTLSQGQKCTPARIITLKKKIRVEYTTSENGKAEELNCIG
jgi:hypothetical protein